METKKEVSRENLTFGHSMLLRFCVSWSQNVSGERPQARMQESSLVRPLGSGSEAASQAFSCLALSCSAVPLQHMRRLSKASSRGGGGVERTRAVIGLESFMVDFFWGGLSFPPRGIRGFCGDKRRYLECFSHGQHII